MEFVNLQKNVWSIFVHNNNILCILAVFSDVLICSELSSYSEILLAVENEQDWDIFLG